VLAGSVQVGARTFVGTAAAVIPGVHVGADVTVGAGSVVLRDVPDGVTAVGVPVRLLESINRGNASQTDSSVATAPVRT
jgi:acetyltransferase-like isoleucine patch superfamily enzyme